MSSDSDNRAVEQVCIVLGIVEAHVSITNYFI